MVEYVPQPHGGALTPWQKGQSGNPGGRPKRFISVTQALEMLGDRELGELRVIARGNGDDKRANVVAAARRLLDQCDNSVRKADQMRATEIVDERLEGKPVQRALVSNDDNITKRIVIEGGGRGKIEGGGGSIRIPSPTPGDFEKEQENANG